MLTGILWPAAVVLLEAITFIAVVLLVRLAIRDDKREQTENAQVITAQDDTVPEGTPLGGSRAA